MGYGDPSLLLMLWNYLIQEISELRTLHVTRQLKANFFAYTRTMCPHLPSLWRKV